MGLKYEICFYIGEASFARFFKHSYDSRHTVVVMFQIPETSFTLPYEIFLLENYEASFALFYVIF